jgi:hypothetical protein
MSENNNIENNNIENLKNRLKHEHKTIIKNCIICTTLSLIDELDHEKCGCIICCITDCPKANMYDYNYKGS